MNQDLPKRPAQFSLRDNETIYQIEMHQIEMTDGGLPVDSWYIIEDLLPNWITVTHNCAIPHVTTGRLRVTVRGHRTGLYATKSSISYTEDVRQHIYTSVDVRPLTDMPGWLVDTVANLGGPAVAKRLSQAFAAASGAEA